MGTGHPHALRLPLLVAACSSVLAYCPLAQASGFQLIEQSVSGMGTAYAGGAAEAEDASTVYFNPAGLTRLKRPQVIAASHIVVPQAEFDDKGSTTLFGASLGAGEGGDAGSIGVIPNLYYSRQLSDNLFFGLGINAPFGLSTKYNKNWVGRYHAVDSEVYTININPSIAFRVNDKVSLGFGVSAQRIKARLTNMIDFGSIGVVMLGAAPAAALGLAPQANDGKITVKGDDWSMGYNIGALFEISDQTRLGVHFRSKIAHNLEGKANFRVPGAAVPLTAGGSFIDTDVKSSTTLPASASVSLFHAINSQWAIMADLTWTEWNRVEELRFDFDSPQADGVTTLKWENTLRYALGLTYAASNRLTYRAGMAFDETPIPNSYYRSPRIPGEDRTWLAFGIGYNYSDQLSFDFGYAHLFMDKVKIRKTAAGENTFRGALRGDYDASVNIISAQLKWAF